MSPSKLGFSLRVKITIKAPTVLDVSKVHCRRVILKHQPFSEALVLERRVFSLTLDMTS